MQTSDLATAGHARLVPSEKPPIPTKPTHLANRTRPPLMRAGNAAAPSEDKVVYVRLQRGDGVAQSAKNMAAAMEDDDAPPTFIPPPPKSLRTACTLRTFDADPIAPAEPVSDPASEYVPLRVDVPDWLPEQDLRVVARHNFYDARVDIPIVAIRVMAETATRLLDGNRLTGNRQPGAILHKVRLSRDDVRPFASDIRVQAEVLKRKCGSREAAVQALDVLQGAVTKAETRALMKVSLGDRIAAFFPRFLGYHEKARLQADVMADARLAQVQLIQAAALVNKEYKASLNLRTT